MVALVHLSLDTNEGESEEAKSKFCILELQMTETTIS